MPVSVFCDPAKNDCNERYRRFYYDTQRCVGCGTECSTSCAFWQGPSYQQYTIINNGEAAYRAAILDAAASGIIGCTLVGVAYTFAFGGNVFAGVVASIGLVQK